MTHIDQHALREAELRLRQLARTVEDVALRARTEAGRGWRSTAGDAFTQQMLETAEQVRACAARFDHAAHLVRQHADRCADRATGLAGLPSDQLLRAVTPEPWLRLP